MIRIMTANVDLTKLPCSTRVDTLLLKGSLEEGVHGKTQQESQVTLVAGKRQQNCTEASCAANKEQARRAENSRVNNYQG